MTASNLEDNEMFYLEQNFEKNHTYTIRFYSEYTNNTDYVAFYKVQDEENLDAEEKKATTKSKKNKATTNEDEK